jgi:hypothetical protein
VPAVPPSSAGALAADIATGRSTVLGPPARSRPSTSTTPVATEPARVAERPSALVQETPLLVDPEPQPRPEVAGRVLVRSLPGGARVLLDGQDVGSTPLPLRAIAFGTHTLRVVQDGYEASEHRVVLTPEQPAQSLIVDLTPVRGAPPAPDRTAAATAGLIVESRPAGATVFLNDRRLGTTPLKMESVATGVHAIRLELEGYRRWSSSVRVAVGERNRVAASLEH